MCAGGTRTGNGLGSDIGWVLSGPTLVAFNQCRLKSTQTIKYILTILFNDIPILAIHFKYKRVPKYRKSDHWNITLELR
jgi:hypothetical protein